VELLDGMGKAEAGVALLWPHGSVSTGHTACREGMILCFFLRKGRVPGKESVDMGIILGSLEILVMLNVT
jgi:hypothetical protein